MISLSELKGVFKSVAATGSEEDGNVWKQIMKELDKNKDNVVSPAEFNEAMNAVLDIRDLSKLEQRVCLE